ncbi:uncharacterized protein [Dendrobates tinctorius]|uniref:uncharacterized protein n=1 Tax=Dendrobates tinctorius TaxID=92724 RepID=UPI003CC9DF3A
MEFVGDPPRRFFLSRLPKSESRAEALLGAIRVLQRNGVIVPVPECERTQGFYSNLFAVPKKDGTVRPVLDLKLLNRFIRVRHFRMESLRSVISAMEQGEYLASIDVQDAYLHISIFPPHQRFLRFAIDGRHFQFVALPFGLATAPRIFTKVMAVVMAILHSRGIVVLPYLDDLLVKGPSFRACEENVSITLDTLSRLGWLVNGKKSSLIPAQRIPFLGMIFDTSRGLVILPQDKARALRQGVWSLQRPGPHTIRFRMRVLGRMVAAMEAIPFAQFHLRPLQHALLASWDRSPFSLDHQCRLSSQVQRALQWWTRNSSLLQGKPFPPDQWLVITTDASLLDWGAVFRHHKAQGQWSPQEAHLPINLEIRAVQLALQHFQHLLAGRPVRVQSDNATVVAYVNHQGGTRSRATMRETEHVLRWAREAPLGNLSSSHTRRGKLGSRFPKPARCRGRGMVPAPRGLPADLPTVGDSGRGSDGLRGERQSGHFCRSVSGPASNRSGCVGPTMEPVSAPIPVSPTATSPKGHQKDQDRGGAGNSAGPRLTLSSMVRGSSAAPRRRALVSAGTTRLTVPGADLPPELRGPVFDGMAVESWILTQAGFGREVVATMVSTRKPASAKVYHNTWKVFFHWCREHGVAPLSFSVPNILAFLQSGLDAGLAPSSLRRQMWALSVLFQRNVATNMQVKTFIQGVSHLVPRFRAPIDAWDLNLVLSVLQETPFEPLQEISLSYLSRKVVLVAITSIRRVSELAALSCRAPFLTF